MEKIWNSRVVILCLLATTLVSPAAFSASCGGVSAWSAGCIGSGPGTQRTHAGHLWSVGNWWECNEPGTGGSWTDLGACTTAPGVNSNAASSIGGSYAKLNGNVTTDNGFAVTARGFIYHTVEATVDAATVGTPGAATVVTHGTASTGAYSIDVSSLSRNVTHYFKAYATNASGTNYGSTLSFTTTNTGITFTSTSGGAWGTSTNWSPNGTPNLNGAAPLDTVIIQHAITHTANLLLEDGNVLQIDAGGSLNLTGNITQGVSGVKGTLTNAGTLTASGTYEPKGIGGEFSNTGTMTVGTWTGTNSFDISSSGNITVSGTMTHNGTGNFTSTGGTWTVNALTIGPATAPIDVSSTTVNITTNMNVTGSGSLSADVNSPINIGGNYSNSGSVSTTWGGDVSVTGNYNNSGSATLTIGGTAAIGGDVRGTGSGDITVNGNMDITGELFLVGSANLNGTGIVGWGTADVRGQSSTGYVVCTSGAKHDSEAGAIAPPMPANPLDLTSCAAAVLPVELLNFEATRTGSHVNLSWLTGSEINSDYFEVLMSTDGIYWETVGLVQAAGNAHDVNSYTFETYQKEEELYFQLKSIDIDGAYVLSNIISTNDHKGQGILTAYDNGNEIELIHSISGSSLVVTLVNLSGQTIHVQSADNNGRITIPSSQLSNGMYLITINSENILFSTKVLINRSL